jgi:cobalt-zinc-cadmium efflux system protein
MADSHNHEGLNEFRGMNTRRLTASFTITIIFMLVEFIGGFWVNSMSLVNDAGHMLTHAFSIIIAITGAKIANKPPCHHKTFGSYRAEILAAFINGIFLLLVVAYLIYETIGKIITPEPIDAKYMIIIAILGLIVNIISLFILRDTDHSDLNLKGVISHMAADTGSSVGVIIAAIIIYYTNWVLIDAIISIFISLLILNWAIGVLKESGRILLEYPPQGMTVDEIQKEILTNFNNRIEDISHLHIWTITSNINVVSFHIKLKKVLENSVDKAFLSNELFMELNNFLKEKFNIVESTIQLTQGEEDFACTL